MQLLLFACALCAGCTGAPCDGPACSAHLDAPAGSPWDLEHRFSLGAGSLGEAHCEMAAGARIVVSFRAGPHPVEWDVHSHDAAGVPTIHTGGRSATIEYEFMAPHGGAFFPSWSNTLVPSTVTIDVQLALDEDTELVGWR